MIKASYFKFKRNMLIASALSWALVASMPIINAHGASNGIWAMLCTINGFELVQVKPGELKSPHSKACPFTYFSSFHQHSLPTPLHIAATTLALVTTYAFLALSERFQLAIPRAPPW